VVHSETGFVFSVTRPQFFGPDDLGEVKAIQGSYDLQPLSAFLGTEGPLAAPEPDFPAWAEGAQFDERFFGYVDFMMRLLVQPAERDQGLWDGLARLGIGPEGDFDSPTHGCICVLPGCSGQVSASGGSPIFLPAAICGW
jgi:hypothetical protein